MKVLTDECVLVVARTHPRNTHIKPHPQANSHLASVMAARIYISFFPHFIYKHKQKKQHNTTTTPDTHHQHLLMSKPKY